MSKKSHWEKIYQERRPVEVSWYQGMPDLSLKLIQRQRLSLGASIIDVGGGASRLVDCLLEKGFKDISVLDISDRALESTRVRLGQAADHVHWYSSDITRFEPERQYACWHDRAVFHFLVNDSDRQGYLRALSRGLMTGGQLIIAAFAIGGPEKCSGLQVVQYDADKLVAVMGDDFDLIEQQDELHRTPGGNEQQFSYFCLRKKA